MIRPWFSTLSLLALLPCAVLAQPVPTPPAQPPPPGDRAEGFTLLDALRTARAHPRLAPARSQLRAASHDVAAAGRWTNPLLGVSYMRSLGFTTFDPDLGVPQVGVTQMIETAGVPSRRRRAAEGDREAARFELEGTRRSIELNVGVTFVRLAVSWSRQGLLREHLARTEQLVALVTARVAAGSSPGYERTRASLVLSEARAALGDAGADVTAARGDFDVAVGPAAATLRGEPRVDLLEDPELPPLERMLEALPTTRAEVGAGRAREQAARARIEVARGEVMPGFALYGGLLAGQGFGEQGQRQIDFLVGVTVPLPVINSGQDAVRAAEARAVAAREEVEVELAAARTRVRSAWRAAQQRRETLATFLASAPDQERLLTESTAAYRDGRIPIQALVDAYDAVRDARLRALELLGDAREAEAGLWEAIGVLPAASAGP